MILDRQCPMCGLQYTMEVDEINWSLREAGYLVQNAFPNEDATFREKIITGMCEDCQSQVFAKE